MNDLREAELRGNVPKRLLQLIDALQQARGHTNRMDVVIPVLEAMWSASCMPLLCSSAWLEAIQTSRSPAPKKPASLV